MVKAIHTFLSAVRQHRESKQIANNQKYKFSITYHDIVRELYCAKLAGSSRNRCTKEHGCNCFHLGQLRSNSFKQQQHSHQRNTELLNSPCNVLRILSGQVPTHPRTIPSFSARPLEQGPHWAGRSSRHQTLTPHVNEIPAGNRADAVMVRVFKLQSSLSICPAWPPLETLGDHGLPRSVPSSSSWRRSREQCVATDALNF